MATITPDDLAPFLEAVPLSAPAMIEDAEAQAAMVAPCLATPEELSDMHRAGARAILRRAILRWIESGVSGTTTRSQSAGPFSQSETFSQPAPKTLFWPSEITSLQDICKAVTGSRAQRAFNVDQVGTRELSPVLAWLRGEDIDL